MLLSVKNNRGGYVENEEFQKLAKAAGVSRQEIADEMGVSKQMVSFWWRGDRRITEDHEPHLRSWLSRRALEHSAYISKTLVETSTR